MPLASWLVLRLHWLLADNALETCSLAEGVALVVWLLLGLLQSRLSLGWLVAMTSSLALMRAGPE